MSTADVGPQESPSGDQYVITHGDSRAIITRVGATLRSYTVAGHDVIDGFDHGERATDGRGQVLAPWPNRLSDGRYEYGGHDCQAPLNEVERHDAIHGLVRWLDWTLVDRSPAAAALACSLRPQPGYEWHLALQVVYALGEAGLTVTFRAVNLDREPAPFGVGFHPYLTLGTPTIDGLDLMVPGAVASAAYDFRAPRRIGSIEMDLAFGDLAVGPDDRAVARLTDPVHERSVELWVDQAFRYLMIYTGDQVADPTRRRTAVAVEPMTCPPDAFRTGTDLIELEPGEHWQGSWGIRSVQAHGLRARSR